jgi:hypothetical protein
MISIIFWLNCIIETILLNSTFIKKMQYFYFYLFFSLLLASVVYQCFIYEAPIVIFHLKY